MANELDNIETPSNEVLISLSEEYGVKEINYISRTYVITYSTNPEYINFSMYGEERGNHYQSENFMDNLFREGAYVAKFSTNEYGVYMKYAGVRLDNGDYVQIGLDTNDFGAAIGAEIDVAASYRQVGRTGYILLADGEGNIVGQTYKDNVLSKIGLSLDNKKDDGYYKAILRVEDSGKTIKRDIYYSFRNLGGYYILSLLPLEEVNYNRDLSSLITVYTEDIIFSVLFMIVYSLIERFIIKDIDKVNGSLMKITKGDLNAEYEGREDGRRRFL